MVLWDLVQETLKMRRIVEFGDVIGMVVCNTFFKEEDSKLITHQFGDNRSLNGKG